MHEVPEKVVEQTILVKQVQGRTWELLDYFLGCKQAHLLSDYQIHEPAHQQLWTILRSLDI